mgnify:CR=1 FL=1
MAVDLVLKRECAIGPVEGWRKLVPESWALRYVAACLQFRYTCLQLFTLRGVFDQMVGPCNSAQEGKGEAFYEVGVHDNGELIGISYEECAETILVLYHIS